MENVSQETLKKVAIKYFKLYENEYSLHTLKIIYAHPELGNAFPMIMEIEKLPNRGYEISFTNIAEDDLFHKDTNEMHDVENYINNITGNIISIQLIINGETDYGVVKYSVFLYKAGVLFVYPGNDCLDKNLKERIKLEADIAFRFHEIKILEDHVYLINDIREWTNKPKEIQEQITKLKKTRLQETNPLNASIIQLALSRNNSFGETAQECFRFINFYKNNIKEITNTKANITEFMHQSLFVKNCNGVIKLIRDLERIMENLDKIKDHINKFIYAFLDEENLHDFDNLYEELKYKKEKLSKKITKADEKYKKLEKKRKKQSKEMKKVTGVIHATVPFSFGKKIMSDIKYLQKISTTRYCI
jgi:hypothetical protein